MCVWQKFSDFDIAIESFSAIMQRTTIAKSFSTAWIFSDEKHSDPSPKSWSLAVGFMMGAFPTGTTFTESFGINIQIEVFGGSSQLVSG